MGKYGNVRKPLGILVAVLVLAGAAAGSRGVDVARAKAIRSETERAATTAAQRVSDALTAVGADLKLKADNAAANPRLVFALQGNVDERTMRDLWRTEEWWRPWRTEFKVYAVAVAGLQLDVVEGIDPVDLNAESLIKHVRDRGDTAAEIVVGKGWPYAATATAVRVPGRDKSPVLVLAKPVDQTVLRKLSEKTGGGALTLTDGRKSLIDAGPQAERTALAQAIGSESTGLVFHAPDGSSQGTWAAAASVVAPGLWLWTYASAQAAMQEAQATATERKLMLWVVAALIAGMALVLGLRRSRSLADASPVTSPAVFPQTDVSPAPSGQGPGSTMYMPDTLRGQGPATAPVTAVRDVDARGVTAVANNPGGDPRPTAGSATFGRYTLLDRLGEGGMAEVYTAVAFGAEGFRRKFVIKRLRAELARDPAAVAQFIDEANLASSMVHSNIVPVFDFGKVGDEYFIAQEYILGRDLSRVTRRSLESTGEPLPSQVMLYAAHETLKALEYAHTKGSETGAPLGIVHRDVSPTNVIVSARGEVKLFDFGIVKAEGRVTKTESGVVKGNVTFMSPEQARGLAVDARADLFSLGLVLYYCLTGRALYTGGTTYELLLKAAVGPGDDEFVQLQALPDPCGTLLRRALQVKPDDRFQTAREFGDAVSAHIGRGAAHLAALMHRLFAADFTAEENKFRRYGSSGLSGAEVDPDETNRRRT